MSTPWSKGPTECEKCKCDLRQVNPLYTDKAHPGKGWCSRLCRDGEGDGALPIHGKAPSTQPLPTPVAKKATPAKPLPAKPAPTAPPKKAPAPTAKQSPAAKKAAPVSRGSSPWSNLDGKLHKTGKTPPNFAGARKQVWEMIKDGEKLSAFYARCEKAGLDGKSNLAKIIGVYGCAEVK